MVDIDVAIGKLAPMCKSVIMVGVDTVSINNVLDMMYGHIFSVWPPFSG